jgi:hypothetical protein
VHLLQQRADARLGIDGEVSLCGAPGGCGDPLPHGGQLGRARGHLHEDCVAVFLDRVEDRGEYGEGVVPAAPQLAVGWFDGERQPIYQ